MTVVVVVIGILAALYPALMAVSAAFTENGAFSLAGFRRVLCFRRPF